MSHDNWIELALLAELHCPQVLLDMPLLMETDARGVLCWLRAKAKAKKASA
jgi:hypothetical protein